MKHKHAEFIHAWAEGHEIQWLDSYGDWCNIAGTPSWNTEYTYRIKPEPKPDVVHELSIMLKGNNKFGYGHPNYPSLRITFDGETGALKSAEVL